MVFYATPHSRYSFPLPRVSSGIRNMLLWDSLTAIERAHPVTCMHQQCCKQRYRTHSQNIVAILDQCKLFRRLQISFAFFLSLGQQVALVASSMTDSKNAQFFLNNRLHSLLQKHITHFPFYYLTCISSHT